jgi:starch synthase
MNVLLVAAELSPYAAQTPAADSVASLVKTLRQIGHAVTVALPHYPGFEQQGLLAARRLTPLSLPGGGEVSVYDGQLASGARLVLFDAPELFDRPGVYGDETGDYPDNARRFGLLSLGATALIGELGRQGQLPDVAHLHDWPAALVPVLLTQEPNLTVPTTFTVHDARRQGAAEAEQLAALGAELDSGTQQLLLEHGRINLLGCGVYFADALTTVSTQYAERLRGPAHGEALFRAIASCDKPVVGIENGIDYSIYNPATDPALISRYTAADVSNKGRCKTALIQQLGLELELERPLIAASGHLCEQAGFVSLADAAPALLKSDMTLIVAGDGDVGLKQRYQQLGSRFPATFGYIERPDAATLRRLVAAADLVIAPARHEPCDPLPLIAQRYGALPIARASGGTLDTVVDCDLALQTGSGFLYAEDSSHDLLGATQRGVAAYRSEGWSELRWRVMARDLSWDRPTRRYLLVYREAVRARA